jgi:hypothetical protein
MVLAELWVLVEPLRADIERKIQQILHSTFGYVQDDKFIF